MQRLRGLTGWLSEVNDWIRAHPIGAVTILTPLSTIVLYGIVQELANHVFDSVVIPWLGIPLPLPRGIDVIALCVLGLVGYGAYQRSLESTRLRALINQESPVAVERRMKTAEGQRALFGGYLNTSVEVLEALVTYLAQISWSGGDPEQAKKLLIRLILKRIQLMYTAQIVPYASVFTPSPADPEYLTIYESVNMNAERIKRARRYIGPDKIRQKAESGSAGHCFLKRKPIVHHVDPRTNRAEEGRDFVPSRKPGEVAVYISFVVMPIIDNNQCLGVLCVDSSARETFDGDPEQAELQPAVRLLAQVLKLMQQPSLQHSSGAVASSGSSEVI